MESTRKRASISATIMSAWTALVSRNFTSASCRAREPPPAIFELFRAASFGFTGSGAVTLFALEAVKLSTSFVGWSAFPAAPDPAWLSSATWPLP